MGSKDGELYMGESGTISVDKGQRIRERSINMEKGHSTTASKDRLIDHIDNPADLKKLEIDELERLAAEIRNLIIETVSRNGGHLAPSLGVVELTIALHYVFSSPKDKIIWDVGHQSYAHKIITGRRCQFHTLRKDKGISGFPKRGESVRSL